MWFLSRLPARSLVFAVLAACSLALVAAAQAPMNWTAEQDQANMMKQLGITKLRPARDSNPASPNYANYDESKANPYPDIPDALVMNDGRKVMSAAMWWKERRPQLVDMFEKYVYGRVPENLPKIHWTAVEDHEHIGFTPVDVKDLIGTVDNTSDPDISVKIHMTLVLPANVKGPIPVLIMFGRAGFPNPSEPNSEEMAKVDQTWKDLLIKQDPSLKDVFAKYPAWHLAKETPFHFPQLNADGDFPNDWQLVGAGWGYVLLDPASVQADNGAGLTRGIIGLANHGQPRKPDQWGALRAWAWGASRALDYLETVPQVDSKHVGIDGVSRYGKAALVTMAFDQRFAMVLVGSSGKGGATLFRRNYGEAVENLTGGEYYWMAGNFMKYGAEKASFGSMNPGDLPVDSNELIALCAPRLTFISYGNPEKGDAHWLDHLGGYRATVAASPVFELLGAKGLGVHQDYHTAEMPPMNEGLLSGHLAWRQHDGGHTDAPNMKWFIQWVDENIDYKPTH
ncbi:MAG TPA: hypothetical protein VG844_03285 [Terracidiphilus sp.]|nr:hypothetical protein [Terracidiphilus sp.]